MFYPFVMHDLHCILHDIYLKSWHSSALKVCWSSNYHIMSWGGGALNNNGEEGGGEEGGCGVLPTSLTNVCVMCYICLLLLEKSKILPKAMHGRILSHYPQGPKQSLFLDVSLAYM